MELNSVNDLTIDLNSETVEIVEDPTSVIAQMRRLQKLNENGDLDDFLCTADYEYVRNYDYQNYGIKHDYEISCEKHDDEEEFENIEVKAREDDNKRIFDKSQVLQPLEYETIEIDRPIRMNRVKINFSVNKKIGSLPLIAIADQLEMPLNVTVTTWREIAHYFRLSSSVYRKLENSQNSCLDLLDYLADQPAQELVFALECARRIDVMTFLKAYERRTRNNQIFNLNSASTYRLSSSSIQLTHNPLKINRVVQPSSSLTLTRAPIIFINHAERNSEEMKNYRWLLKNLKNNLKTFNFQIIDISNVEEDYVLVNDVYKYAKHILICYNTSYFHMLETDQEAWKFRKRVHNDTYSEFYSNGMKNYRFRSILMPGTTKSETTGWAPTTIQYSFPNDLQGLLKRIVDHKSDS